MKPTLFFTLALFCQLSVVAQTNFDKFYIGTHRLTLQWLDKTADGTAVISKNAAGQLTITGTQHKDEKDFVRINGTITPIGEREFAFNGMIITCAHYINNGQPCEKQGNYTFKASGQRKFWRLQQMENCEGNSVVDYVDIFFLKR